MGPLEIIITIYSLCLLGFFGYIIGTTNEQNTMTMFIALLMVMLSLFGIVLGSSTRQDIMAHWDERRCDLDVMFMGFLYKPDSNKTSAISFSTENFNFCIGTKTTAFLNTLFAPLFEILKKQMDVADIMRTAMNSLREMTHDIFAPFSTLMDKFWNKFKQIGALSSRIFQQLYMAMKKAAGITTASMYLAISLQASFMNGIDLVINVIMIVLIILLVLAIIFFLPILPVMVFVIIAMTGIESAFPGRTGDMGGIFCFAPNTKVLVAGGYSRNIQELALGDILADGSTVEAVVELPGPSSPLYELNGVYVSGGHRVWSTETGDFVSVKDHPDAIISEVRVQTVWTLITSSRVIPVKGDFGPIRFADWEELPADTHFSEAWDLIVRDMLNSDRSPADTLRAAIPKYAPCLDMSMMVKTYSGGLVPLVNVKRGDWILDSNSWTQVIGICRREVNGGIGNKGSRLTDGVWILGDDNIWVHPSLEGLEDQWKWQGMQLITDSGQFKVYTADTQNSYIVRDFTEVGHSRLAESYVREDALLLEKKLATEK